ncbi:hypothetical protein NHX12_001779 [Muraenolepis orangiensis]|uniref:MoaB/Mog domain-containing protein n=1 Tax=Muraenolepis orangiensis TaxID=630683 RepID=A0A9Q0E1J5_9TELE|nr:hypothetical protein NHX12_001779 [Muraenolepis orangiensis]
MQAVAKLSRAAVRVRRLAAQVTKETMADSHHDTRPYSTAKNEDEDGCTTAAILIIGDEILKGHTVDTNSTFLTRALRKLGVSVQRINVVPDVQEVIAKEVALLSPQYTHLLTSGGIGPTHDDVTFESVAMAFQEEVHLHPELAGLVTEFFGPVDKESSAAKLATVPLSAKLNYGVDPQTGKPLRYPLVSVRNVYIFPGIPSLLERAFSGVEHLFAGSGTSFHTREHHLALFVSLTSRRPPLPLNEVQNSSDGWILSLVALQIRRQERGEHVLTRRKQLAKVTSQGSSAESISHHIQSSWDD